MKISALLRSSKLLPTKRLLRNRMAIAGTLLLLLLIGLTVMAPLIAPYNPVAMVTESSLQAPSARHFLGTDSLGRDVLSRVIYGGRISLGVALASVLIASLVGVPSGLMSGYLGRWTDNTVMRLMDTILSFPSLVLAIVIVGSLGPSIRNVTLALGIVYSPLFARLVRGVTLAARELEYVVAARAVGASSLSIVLRHILPNLSGPMIVQATVTFSWAIIAEASLSFLGLGAQPPTPSWGHDLSEGRQYIDQASWVALGPCLAIVTTVLATNFLGDGLQDALDPRRR
jgi:peptide/nickel transport system permease protein